MILIVLQLAAIFTAMFLLGYEAYYFLGLVSAIFLIVTGFSAYKKEIESKFRDADFPSINVETSIRISLWATIIGNFVIAIVAWPAVMVSKFFAGFVLEDS